MFDIDTDTDTCGVDPKHGRRATWVGASGDQTFVRIDESLINVHTLSTFSIVANHSCIGQSRDTHSYTYVC